MASNREFFPIVSKTPDGKNFYPPLIVHKDLTRTIMHHLSCRLRFFTSCCVTARLLADIIRIEKPNFELFFTSATHQLGKGSKRKDDISHNSYSSNNSKETKQDLSHKILRKKALCAKDIDAAHVCAVGLAQDSFLTTVKGLSTESILLSEKLYNSLVFYMRFTNYMPTFINQSTYLDKMIDKIQIETIHKYVNDHNSSLKRESIKELVESYQEQISNNSRKADTSIEILMNHIYKSFFPSDNVDECCNEINYLIKEFNTELSQSNNEEFKKKFYNYCKLNDLC